MAVKGIKLPDIDVPGMPGFLLWARRDQPKLYAGLIAAIPAVSQFEEELRSSVDPDGGLSGFMDVLSSIGSGISNAAKGIVGFVGNNAPALISGASSLLVAKQQLALTNSQLALAQAQRPPAATAQVQTATGQYITVPIAPSGAPMTVPPMYTYRTNAAGQVVAIPNAVARQLEPSLLDKLLQPPGVYYVAGAAGLLVLLLMRRK